MSSVTALNGGMIAYYANLSQTLFNQIDSSGTGSITKSELESAVTKAGGTTASADALYAELDPNGTGSVSESQFSNTVQSMFSPEMGAQLISAQEGATNGTSSTGGFAQQLFSQLTNGGDSLTKAQLEQAVTQNGGTTAAADALWSQLDPSGANSITEQQFAANLPQPGSVATATDGSNGTSSAGGFAQQLFSQLTNGGDSLTKAQLEQAVTQNGGTTAAADALWSQLDPSGADSITEQQFAANLPQPGSFAMASDGSNGSNGSNDSNNSNSAQDAMAALLQAMAPPPPPAGTDGANWSTASTTASGSDQNSAQSALQDLIQSDGSSSSNSALSALQDLLQNDGSSSSTGATSSANSAQDALMALLNQNGTSSANLLGSLSYANISELLQTQSGTSVLI